jgi:hypothetical protein
MRKQAIGHTALPPGSRRCESLAGDEDSDEEYEEAIDDEPNSEDLAFIAPSDEEEDSAMAETDPDKSESDGEVRLPGQPDGKTQVFIEALAQQVSGHEKKMKAIQDELRELKERTPTVTGKRNRRPPERLSLLNYLADPDEGFARAYRSVAEDYYEGIEHLEEDSSSSEASEEEPQLSNVQASPASENASKATSAGPNSRKRKVNEEEHEGREVEVSDYESGKQPSLETLKREVRKRRRISSNTLLENKEVILEAMMTGRLDYLKYGTSLLLDEDEDNDDDEVEAHDEGGFEDGQDEEFVAEGPGDDENEDKKEARVRGSNHKGQQAVGLSNKTPLRSGESSLRSKVARSRDKCQMHTEQNADSDGEYIPSDDEDDDDDDDDDDDEEDDQGDEDDDEEDDESQEEDNESEEGATGGEDNGRKGTKKGEKVEKIGPKRQRKEGQTINLENLKGPCSKEEEEEELDELDTKPR